MTKQEFLEQLQGLLADVTEEERAEAIRFYEEYFDEAGPEQEEHILSELGSPQKVAAIIRANVPGSRPVQTEPQLTLDGVDWEAQAAKARADELTAAAEAEAANIPLPMYARPGYQQPQAPQPGEYGSDFGAHAEGRAQYGPADGGAQYATASRQPAQKRRMNDKTILIIILICLLFPVWGGLFTGLLGLIFGILSAGFAMMFAGVTALVAAIAVAVVNLPAAFAAGVGVGLLTLGLLLFAVTIGFLVLIAGIWFTFRLIPCLWKFGKDCWNKLFRRVREA